MTPATDMPQRQRAPTVLGLPRVGRRIRVPVWAVAVVFVWLALVGLCEWLEPADANVPSLCRVKAVTGIACPTCGTTRAVKAAVTGDVIGAWLFNPFVVTALLAGALWLTWRFATGRAVVLRLNRSGRIAVWSVIAALFALNWAYLIWRGV